CWRALRRGPLPPTARGWTGAPDPKSHARRHRSRRLGPARCVLRPKHRSRVQTGRTQRMRTRRSRSLARGRYASGPHLLDGAPEPTVVHRDHAVSFIYLGGTPTGAVAAILGEG